MDLLWYNKAVLLSILGRSEEALDADNKSKDHN